jgi:hypothetical protein
MYCVRQVYSRASLVAEKHACTESFSRGVITTSERSIRRTVHLSAISSSLARWASSSAPVTHYLLFVMSLADGIVEVLGGVTAKPDEGWMLQLGRNLIDWEHGALREKCYMIIDRDNKYTEQFRRLVRESGPR